MSTHDLDPREQERLRALLHDSVSDVEPGYGLDAIRSRTKVAPMRTRPWILGAGAAVVATAATVAAVAVLGPGPGTTTDPGPVASPSGSQSPTGTPEPAPTVTPAPTADGSPVPTEAAVPVYYVGEGPRGPVLFREFHGSAGGPAVEQAVSDAVSRPADDPDYGIPWPAGTGIGTVEAGPDLISVEVTSPSGTSLRARPDGMSQRLADLAVQQLVYTATAAAQADLPVQLLLDGGRTDTLLGVPVSEPLARADQISTLNLVLVTEPAQGAEVSGSFVAEGLASSFEAHVPWEVRRGEKVVLRGFSTTEGWMDRLYPWRTEPIDVSGLAPGEYTFVALTDDPSGGAEGFGPSADTRTIRVR